MDDDQLGAAVLEDVAELILGVGGAQRDCDPTRAPDSPERDDVARVRAVITSNLSEKHPWKEAAVGVLQQPNIGP